MQKKVLVAAAAMAVLYASSCKKDDVPVDPVVEYDNYSQLKVGNYWIYQIYEVDSLGNGPATSMYDSTYIDSSRVINGNTYYALTSTFPHNVVWMRDSLHYVVGERGGILFSSEDFTTVFYSAPYIFEPDTIAFCTQKMVNDNTPVVTPAGTFTTLDFQTVFNMRPDFQQAGVRRVIHRRYVKNIGIVSETTPFFINNPGYREKRLVRYHLN